MIHDIIEENRILEQYVTDMDKGDEDYIFTSTLILYGKIEIIKHEIDSTLKELEAKHKLAYQKYIEAKEGQELNNSNTTALKVKWAYQNYINIDVICKGYINRLQQLK